jgi:peptidylprolyl isomerase
LIKLKAKKGDTISVHYTGTFEDGKVFDSSEGKLPLQFEVGKGEVIKGFDDAVLGMDVNEEKEITIKPEEAYGKREEKLVQHVPRAVFGENAYKLKAGVVLGLKDPSGRTINASVADVSEDKVTLDLNHPLAGKTLKFKIKVVEIK